MQSMKIGEVAKASGVGVETIRYYEREGLLLAPQRRPSGYRQYDDETVARLVYIRRAKELGFTLAEIRELLELCFVHQTCCEPIRRRAEQKVEAIEAKIRSLKQMRRSLVGILQRCGTHDSVADCPLVHPPAKRPAGSSETSPARTPLRAVRQPRATRSPPRRRGTDA